MMLRKEQLIEIASMFKIEGECVDITPLRVGHLHETFVSVVETSVGTSKYLHQKINTSVFSDVTGLMDNILAVTEHLTNAIEIGKAPSGFQTFCVIETLDNRKVFKDTAGSYWRTFSFISDTGFHHTCPDEKYAHMAGKAFGTFLHLLQTLDVSLLHTTIPDFDNLPLRFEKLREAIENDPCARLSQIEELVETFVSKEQESSILCDLEQAGFSKRSVSHYDPKINNLLYDIIS